jgi:hypothetical protein
MKEFTLTSPFTCEDIPVTVNIRKYENGRSAIELLEMDPAYGPTPYMTASVNIPNVLLQDNEVLIKDYSENEGITNFLAKHNIVTPTNNWVKSGYVDVQVCVLNPESEWGLTPSVYSLDEEPEYDEYGTWLKNKEVTDNIMPPPPDEINTQTGKSMWIINDYKIWADSYDQALQLLPMIESF